MVELIDIQLICWEQEDSLPHLLTEWPLSIDQRAQSDSLILLREWIYSIIQHQEEKSTEEDVKMDLWIMWTDIKRLLFIWERGN